MQATEIRLKRTLAGIPGSLLAQQAGVDRSRLSLLERGYVKASAGEMARLETALENLIRAKQAVSAFAVTCGWPTAAL